eukprot:12851471-Ditylum_brightwellii.AAC.1
MMTAVAASSMMPGLAKAEAVIFFMSPTSIDVVKETLVELGQEGIIKAEDLAKFGRDTWKQVLDNLNCPGGWMNNLNKVTNKNLTMIPQTRYVSRAKIQKRLLKASKLMGFYETVGWKVMVANTVYKTVIKSFLDQWKGPTN